MINTVNNFNGLNINANKNLTSSVNKSNLEKFLNELLTLMLENKSFTDDEKVVFIPCLSFQFMTSQEIANLNKLCEILTVQKEGLNSLYEKIKSGQVTLNNIVQNLKIQGNVSIDLYKLIKSRQTELNNIIDNLKIESEIAKVAEKFLINFEQNNTKDIFNKIDSQKDKVAIDLSSLNLNKECPKLEEVTNSILKLINIDSLKNGKAKINDLNINKSETIKSDSLSSQVNLNSISFLYNDNMEQKLELPLTKLNEVSDIIFKALSSSQRTLIVHIEPPELGRILIKLSMDNFGVKADMRVDHPYVKEMLTNLIPEIKSNLQSSGVKISDFLLELTRDHKEYSDHHYGQSQRKFKDNQKFIEYFV